MELLSAQQEYIKADTQKKQALLTKINTIRSIIQNSKMLLSQVDHKVLIFDKVLGNFLFFFAN